MFFIKNAFILQRLNRVISGADPGEVKWVNFHPPPFSEPPSFFFFLIPQTPQPGFSSITLSQKFTPHFKILDPRLHLTRERNVIWRQESLDLTIFRLLLFLRCRPCRKTLLVLPPQTKPTNHRTYRSTVQILSQWALNNVTTNQECMPLCQKW